MVYFVSSMVHLSQRRHPLDLNYDRGGMKMLMEKAKVKNVEVNYYTLDEIRVGKEGRSQEKKDDEF